MLNPSEQKKGGFGAAAERARERHDISEAAAAARLDPSAAAPAPHPESVAPDAATDATPAEATPEHPEPRHRRYFGFLLP